jgi:hypothetical protein
MKQICREKLELRSHLVMLLVAAAPELAAVGNRQLIQQLSLGSIPSNQCCFSSASTTVHY